MNREQKRQKMRDLRKEYVAPQRVKHEKRWTRSRAKPGEPRLPNAPSYQLYRTHMEEFRKAQEDAKLVDSYVELSRLMETTDEDKLDDLISAADDLFSRMTPAQFQRAEQKIRALQAPTETP